MWTAKGEKHHRPSFSKDLHAKNLKENRLVFDKGQIILDPCLVYVWLNIQLEKTCGLFVCLKRGLQGRGGSGHWANPQATAASLREPWKMVTTPCLCWQLFNMPPHGKNLLQFPFSTSNPTRFSSIRVIISYCGDNKTVPLHQIPSPCLMPAFLGSYSKAGQWGKDHCGQCNSLHSMEIFRLK